jgi:hypothetical protein
MCLVEITTPAPKNEDLNRLPSFALIVLWLHAFVRDVLCVHACVYVCCACVCCVCVVCCGCVWVLHACVRGVLCAV